MNKSLKFFLYILGGALAGGVLGFGVVWFGMNGIEAGMLAKLQGGMALAAPALQVLAILVCSLAAVGTMKRAGRLAAALARRTA